MVIPIKEQDSISEVPIKEDSISEHHNHSKNKKTKKDENNHSPLSYINSSGNVYDLELITLLVNAEEKLTKDSLRAELKANSDDKKLFEEQKNHEKEEKRKNDANERRSSLLTQYKRWRQND